MKKIKQWLKGFVVACEGFTITLTGIGTIIFFIEIINSTGKDCLINFLLFLSMLLTFIFSPYLAFKDFQLLTKDKKSKEEENTFDISKLDASKGLVASDNVNIITEVPTFVLIGYDKDNDIYENITKDTHLLSLIAIGENYATFQKATDHFKSSKGEPFDWFEIIKSGDTPPCYRYWVSSRKDGETKS